MPSLPPQMKTQCPRLRAVVHVPLEVTSPTDMSRKLNSMSGQSDASRVLLEGLFSHFFSPERRHYHSDDIRWFLELANCHLEWGSGKLEEKCGGLSTELVFYSIYRCESMIAVYTSVYVSLLLCQHN